FLSILDIGNQRIGSKEILGRHSERRPELRAARHCSKLPLRYCKCSFFSSLLSK
ncbi:hypothetical protein BCV71DRAFT_189714, partial [Rhizopus microsporus]